MSTNSERQDLQSLVDSAHQAMTRRAPMSPLQLPYAAPDYRANPPVERLDWLRAGLLLLSCVLLALTVLAFSLTGAARADTEVFSVAGIQRYAWPLISLYLLASAIFALLRHQVPARRQRAVGIYTCVMAATLGCALTLAASFLPWPAALLASVGCVAGLLGIRELNRHTARNNVERLLTDAPLGLCTGFSLVFTAQLYFAAAGWIGAEHSPKALVAVVLLSVLASVAAHSERGRHALALGFIAAAVGVAVPQWLADQVPWWLPVATVLSALMVLLAAENRRHQLTHAEHRAARGMPVDN